MKELRNRIYEELKKVTAVSAPDLYEAIQTESGYKQAEEMIIQMMYDEQMSISGCIPNVNNMI